MDERIIAKAVFLSIRKTGTPTSVFQIPFSSPKQACDPEARALRGKSIGRGKILPGDPSWLPQNGAGRLGARPGAPTPENPCSP